jgi:hypothetical protein
MKKLFLILVIAPLFWGCEKYELPSEPSVAGKWYFDDYTVTIVQSLSKVQVIKSDTICINNFGDQSFVSGGILMKQNYNKTSIDRRFIKGVTTWDFDGPSQSTFFPLRVNNSFDDEIYVKFPRPYLPNKYGDYIQTEMVVSNHMNGNETNFTFTTDKFGAGYSRVMTLTSPNISTDLYLSSGIREKAVTAFVTLTFKRN